MAGPLDALHRAKRGHAELDGVPRRLVGEERERAAHCGGDRRAVGARLFLARRGGGAPISPLGVTALFRDLPEPGIGVPERGEDRRAVHGGVDDDGVDRRPQGDADRALLDRLLPVWKELLSHD